MKLKEKLVNISGWDCYALVILLFCVVIQSLKWVILPIFVDIYYHLLTAVGFNQAGGWVHSCLWEYAPVGRPQVYPPLLHIIILSLIKTGIPILTIGKLIQFIIYPSLLFTIWFVVRKIFDQRQAFFTLAMIFLSYPFYLIAINTVAASLSLIFCLLSLLYLEKNKIVTSAAFLAISFYAHGYTSWIFVAVFIIYGILNRKKISLCLKVVLFALCLASPFLIFQFLNRNYFLFPRNLIENSEIEIDILNWTFFLFGLVTCLRKRGRHWIFLALFISTLIFLSSGHLFRYFSFYGIISIFFMNAAFFSVFYNRLDKRYRKTLLIIFTLFYIFSPTLIINLSRSDTLKDKFISSSHGETLVFRRGIFTLNLLDSNLSNFIFYYHRPIRSYEVTVYYPRIFSEVKDVIVKNTDDKDIIYANFSYTAGILSLLSGRATSTAMLSEVKPYNPFDKISVSKLIIWQKNPDNIIQEPVHLIRKYHLNKIADTKLAFIYENPECHFKKQTQSATISYKILFILLFLVFVFVPVSRKFGIDK